jgi:hypothetical protein
MSDVRTTIDNQLPRMYFITTDVIDANEILAFLYIILRSGIPSRGLYLCILLDLLVTQQEYVCLLHLYMLQKFQ